MTSIDRMPTGTLSLDRHPHAVVDAAIRHAVQRDVDRLRVVLGDPVTEVRRAALIGHVTFLLDQLQAHHRLQDEVIWPRIGVARADLADLGDRVRLSHAELVEPSRTVRRAVQRWTFLPASRPDVLTAIEHLDDRLAAVLAQDAELVPMTGPALSEREWSEIGRHAPARGGPTRRARRTFWLLDQLDAEQKALLLRRTSRAEMWILRNGFSGGYNRAAFLMWVGGGTGPAV